MLENPHVGLVFVVPKCREVVRVSGTAQVVTDGSLLESMAVDGKVPSRALLVRGSVEGLPTYGRALVDHAQLDRPPDENDPASTGTSA